MTIMKVKQQDGTIVNVPLGGQTIVDQTYSATSANAQSGVAVAERDPSVCRRGALFLRLLRDPQY